MKRRGTFIILVVMLAILVPVTYAQLERCSTLSNDKIIDSDSGTPRWNPLNPDHILGVSENSPARIAVTHDAGNGKSGTRGDPSASFYRWDDSDAGPGRTVAPWMFTTIAEGGTTEARYNLLGYAVHDYMAETYPRDVVGAAGISKVTRNSNGNGYGLFADSRLHSTEGRAVGQEIDIRNYSGNSAPFDWWMPGGTTGLALVGLGPDQNSTGLLFQGAGGGEFKTLIWAGPDAIVPGGWVMRTPNIMMAEAGAVLLRPLGYDPGIMELPALYLYQTGSTAPTLRMKNTDGSVWEVPMTRIR